MKTMSRVGGVLWATVLGLISLSGCRQNTPVVPASLSSLPPPEADGSYHLTAEQLFDPYKVDAKSANKFLHGKTVVVEGWVVTDYSGVEIDKDQATSEGPPPPPDLFLHVNHKSNGFWVSSDGIVCNFSEADRPFLRKFIKKIRRQDQVFIRGIIDKKFGHVFVGNCTLVKITSPADDPSPAELLLSPKPAKPKK